MPRPWGAHILGFTHFPSGQHFTPGPVCLLPLLGVHPCIPFVVLWGHLAAVNSLHLRNDHLWLILPLHSAPEWNCIDPGKKEELDKRAEDGEFW